LLAPNSRLERSGFAGRSFRQLSQVRSAWSARSYEGIEHPAKPSAAAKQSAALVEHALFDDLVRSHQHRLRDGEAECLGSL
jgi:hypothetical protein